MKKGKKGKRNQAKVTEERRKERNYVREGAMVEEREKAFIDCVNLRPQSRNKMNNTNVHLGSLTTRSIVSDSCSASVVS